MIEIRKYTESSNLRYRFWLTTGDEQEECANIQDQVLAIVWGWA